MEDSHNFKQRIAKNLCVSTWITPSFMTRTAKLTAADFEGEPESFVIVNAHSFCEAAGFH